MSLAEKLKQVNALRTRLKQLKKQRADAVNRIANKAFVAVSESGLDQWYLSQEPELMQLAQELGAMDVPLQEPEAEEKPAPEPKPEADDAD